MFLQVFVCPQGGLHCRGAWPGGVYGRGDMHGHCGRQEYVWQEGVHGRGHAWQWGTCMAGERVWPGERAWTGEHAWPGCVCVSPPPPADTTTYGQCSSGTHPTGMHSYWILKIPLADGVFIIKALFSLSDWISENDVKVENSNIRSFLYFAEFILLQYNSGRSDRMIYLRKNSINSATYHRSRSPWEYIRVFSQFSSN